MPIDQREQGSLQIQEEHTSAPTFKITGLPPKLGVTASSELETLTICRP